MPGHGTMTLTQTSEKLVNIIERRVLRRILGAKGEEDQWRIRYKHELY